MTGRAAGTPSSSPPQVPGGSREPVGAGSACLRMQRAAHHLRWAEGRRDQAPCLPGLGLEGGARDPSLPF